MTPFLKQVAEHYHKEGDMEHLCFIFPNRRAMVFFRKYLSLCAVAGGRALLSPRMFTMNDFFYENAGVQPTDDVRLLVELYSCYKELNKTPESLDDFIFWGGVLLSDFNDVDKYLVDPRMLFRNVSDFRGMSDVDSALNETQKAALERLIAHFKTPGHYKDEFRKVWDIMYPLYEKFGERLSGKKYSYEGQVYRRIAERLKEESAVDVLSREFADVRKFVFVGLNALNECEKLLLRKLRNAGLAEFCWDYSGKWTRDRHNKSSFFLENNVSEFPQAFPLDEDGLLEPEFHVLGVPSTVGQAKQLPSIFDRIGAKGIETTIVLPDETLLLPVLNTIPERIRDINVTMGYPMKGSGIWSFMNDIAALQMHLRKGGGDEWTFYYRSVYAVFSNSIFKSVCDDEKAMEIIARVKQEARYYVPLSLLSGHPVFDMVFKPVVLDVKDAGGHTADNLGNYLSDVLSMVAPKLKGKPDMAMELDFAKEYYLAIGKIRGCHLTLRPDSLLRLIEKTVGRITVPFKGEPLNGLQIMGPLETRAVDFDNVVILSCNESIFPHRNVSPSFIPPELRKGFDLPTYEYQDAVWAYYFYRLIQRAKCVWLLYDSHPEGLKSGEESRYIKQLELHFGAKLKRYDFKSTIGEVGSASEIPKTKEHIRIIKEERRLSATALQNYLSCKAKFFYGTVLKLSKTEDIEQSLDAKLVGTVFHAVMQRLYTVPDGRLRLDYLKSLLGDKKDKISDTVREVVLQNLKCPEITGRNLIYEDMICRYVRTTIRYDISILENNKKDSFNIIGLELPVSVEIGDFRFFGIIDRLDSITPGELRIVDYKTGRVGKDDVKIDDNTAKTVVKKIFAPVSKDRPKIALQLYLYDRFVKEKKGVESKDISNSVYGISELLKGTVRTEKANDTFMSKMDEELEKLLCEIADENVPFSLTDDLKQCNDCDFKNICGR